jgi:hypothetical protein
MQARRKSVAATLLFLIALSAGAFAEPREENGKQTPRSREVRKTQKPANPWIGTVITILDWLSIPPG